MGKIDLNLLSQLFGAVDQHSRRQLNQTLQGIEAYRAHPYFRNLSEPPVVWSQGKSQLLDYAEGSTGKPVLFVPSLVNRGYILDLLEDCSLLRWMRDQGLHPYLMDWGDIGEDELGLGLDGYVARLVDAFDMLYQKHEASVGLVGYCMGGLLALALGLQRQSQITGLALMATPWDFHMPSASQPKMLATYAEQIGPMLQAKGQMPLDILQSFFTGIDPLMTMDKFSKFASYDMDSDKARQFVALEDWLNDGVALEAKVAEDCLMGWYGENKPLKGAWKINGNVVNPANFTAPVLALIPTGDRIVPLESATALSDVLPNVEIHHPPLGHIGMVVGRGARDKVWQNLVRFFGEL